jgi:hypothetical protein
MGMPSMREAVLMLTWIALAGCRQRSTLAMRSSTSPAAAYSAQAPSTPLASDPIAAACGSSCACPDFTPAAGTPASPSLVARGSFLVAGADEALVQLSGCEGHSNDYGGTVIVRKGAEGWRRVAYAPGLVNEACTSQTGTDGIGRLACKYMHYANGGSWFNAATIVDFRARRQTFLISGSCEDARDIVTTEFTCGGCTSLDATVVLAHGMKRDYKFPEGCRSSSEAKRESVLKYLDRGDHYEPAPDTLQNLLALPRSPYVPRGKLGYPRHELLPKDYELELTELPTN